MLACLHDQNKSKNLVRGTKP